MTSCCEWDEVNHRLTLALPEAITLRLSKVRHAGRSDDQGYLFQSGSRDAGRDVRTESSPKGATPRYLANNRMLRASYLADRAERQGGSA